MNSDLLFLDVPDAKVYPARSSRGRSTSHETFSLLGERKLLHVIYLFFRKQSPEGSFGEREGEEDGITKVR